MIGWAEPDRLPSEERGVVEARPDGGFQVTIPGRLGPLLINVDTLAEVDAVLRKVAEGNRAGRPRWESEEGGWDGVERRRHARHRMVAERGYAIEDGWLIEQEVYGSTASLPYKEKKSR